MQIVHGMPFVFALQVFAAGGGGTDASGGSGGEAGADILCELYGELSGRLSLRVASVCRSCIVSDTQ